MVKEALASSESRNVAFVPAGIIFLDAEHFDPEPSNYALYVQSFREKFSMKYSKDQLLSKSAESDLPSLLSETDRNFKKFESNFSKQGQMSRAMQSRYLHIWLYKSPLLDATEVCPKIGFHNALNASL